MKLLSFEYEKEQSFIIKHLNHQFMIWHKFFVKSNDSVKRIVIEGNFIIINIKFVIGLIYKICIRGELVILKTIGVDKSSPSIILLLFHVFFINCHFGHFGPIHSFCIIFIFGQ